VENQALFDRHLARLRQNKEMESVHKETQSIINSVFSELINANKGTEQFGGKLDEYTAKLKSANKVQDIQVIMRGLIQETTAAAAAGRQLQEKLNKATQQTEKLQQQLQETKKEAYIDGLTGLNNRKAFDAKLIELQQEFKKHKIYYSVVFVDIDFFKKFNDTYGHKIGDLVLQVVGGILHNGVKGSDFPARYGGEEFCVLLPATTLENAKIVAEQLRMKIAVKKPRNEETGEDYGKITASFGVSQVKHEDTPETVLERADKALYLAKESGRNAVKTEMDL